MYLMDREKGTCFEHECEYGALCLMKKRRPVCECPECAEEFDPVCGTDGISYINECKLNKEACEQRKKIAVAYQGLCSGCEHKHCEYYAACESDSEGIGRCVCPKNCLKVYNSERCYFIEASEEENLTDR
ncbi:Agrin like protein [Argiope bruennichi]|uniref:Agrin like protein n=1 Tax=Argiope bruennichi TaxID=94029 RepID=A0A8T0FN04_ARGBR|nr:Agrin like protein [Argiope bruennichi]